jgi:hypothetical protein
MGAGLAHIRHVADERAPRAPPAPSGLLPDIRNFARAFASPVTGDATGDQAARPGRRVTMS